MHKVGFAGVSKSYLVQLSLQLHEMLYYPLYFMNLFFKTFLVSRVRRDTIFNPGLNLFLAHNPDSLVNEKLYLDGFYYEALIAPKWSHGNKPLVLLETTALIYILIHLP